MEENLISTECVRKGRTKGNKREKRMKLSNKKAYQRSTQNKQGRLNVKTKSQKEEKGQNMES